MTGPTPNSPVRLVPAARTAAAAFVRVSRIRVPAPRGSSVSSAASSQRAASTAPAGVTEARTRAAWPAVISPGTPPGTSPQHLVQPAGHLGAGPAQVPVALGPDLEHRGVIITPHLPDLREAQRGDRRRAGIAGIVLAD